MEAKLRDFRERKYKREPPGRLKKTRDWVVRGSVSVSNKISYFFRRTEEQDNSTSASSSDFSYRSQRMSQLSAEPQQDSHVVEENRSLFTYIGLAKLFSWLILWGVFVQLGFGAVFLVVSALIFIYFSTRKNPNQDGKLSAYSVFNPKFERIDGTLTAEQFEKELKFGPGAVH